MLPPRPLSGPGTSFGQGLRSFFSSSLRSVGSMVECIAPHCIMKFSEHPMNCSVRSLLRSATMASRNHGSNMIKNQTAQYSNLHEICKTNCDTKLQDRLVAIALAVTKDRCPAASGGLPGRSSRVASWMGLRPRASALPEGTSKVKRVAAPGWLV